MCTVGSLQNFDGQTNNTTPTSTLSLAFNGFTIINGVASANPNLQNAVVSANNVIVNVGGGTPTIVPTLSGLLQVLDLGSFFITPVNSAGMNVTVTGFRSGSLKSGANVTLNLSTATPHFQVFLPQPAFTAVDTVYVTPASSGAAGEFAIDNVCVQQYLLTGVGR